jgi:hypothetical protein
LRQWRAIAAAVLAAGLHGNAIGVWRRARAAGRPCAIDGPINRLD